MRLRGRSRFAQLAVATMAAALVVGAGPGAGAEPDPRTQAPKAERQSVTLITGDQVVVEPGNPGGLLRPGPGREHMTFATFTTEGHQYVIPTDAAPLVAKGALDRRLFDITGLLAAGYGDTERDTLPLLMDYADAGQAAATMSTAPGAEVTRQLPSIGGAAVTAAKAEATRFWAELTGPRTLSGGVERIWLDGRRQASLDRSVPQIGAPTAWEAGYTGDGSTIAVLDTGVDQTHPDLAEQEKGERNFTDAPDAVDHFGHGTHVASIAAGTGAKSGGKFKGVAPDAAVLDGKVLNDNGSGMESWIIAGMEWAAEQGADIANLSLGGGDTAEVDPLEEAVDSLSAEHGTLFVIAAGNSGPGAETVGSPGSADAALTVGAVDRDDTIAPFSSRGPRIGDGGVKPDITGPGVGIVAALHADGSIGEPVEPGYTALSGTSMATPHVAGAAALLAQQHPDLTGAQLKGLLTASAKPGAGLGPFDQGSGRVDSARVLTQTLRSEPTSVSLGTQRWPHDDDKPVDKDVTFSNAGAEDVTLQLAIEATGPDGKPAPAGVFTSSASEVTVPAGGTATVTVTGDTRAGTVDGAYSGTLVATAGEAAVRTPLAINREVESYDVTLNTLGRDGGATGEYSTFLFGVDSGDFLLPYDEDGSVTTRVPKGRYLLQTTVGGTEPGGPVDLLAYPNLTVDGDLTVDLDARRARPGTVTPPEGAGELQLGEVSFTRTFGRQSFSSSFLTFGDFGDLRTAHLGPGLPPGELSSLVGGQWTGGSGDYYGLAWYAHGRTPTGFEHGAEPGELATVRARFAPVPDGMTRLAGANPSPHLRQGGGWAVLLPVPESGTRTEHYNTDGLDWNRVMLLEDTTNRRLAGQLQTPPRTYQAGRGYSESFGDPVLGPVLPESRYPYDWVIRDGDTISVFAPLFGDAAGNSGSLAPDSSSVRLFRDGTEIPAERGRFEVPPGNAGYRLVAEASQSVLEHSSKVSAAWTFTSDTTEGLTRLPVSTIRFFPELDEAGSAPGGRTFVFPVAVQEQGSGQPKVPYKLTAEVSYDGGQTWRPAAVLGGNTQLAVQHPTGAGTVSLRAKATDGNGNTVEQTIIDAYSLR